MQLTECCFNVGPIELHGQRWQTLLCEQTPVRKIIALHGWLDNCASFAMLAHRLGPIDMIALDLAGHGRSGHRPGIGAYNIWADIAEILLVAEHLDWQSFTVIGHSRGAMIATLLAGAYPQKVDALVAIDAVLPILAEPAELPQQLACAIDTSLSLLHKKIHYYPSLDAAIGAREKGVFSVSRSAAEAFAERGVLCDEKGFYWCSDIKLLAPSEIRLCREQALAFVAKMATPALVIIAEHGYLVAYPELVEWLDSCDTFSVARLPGDHHLHMSDDATQFSQLADTINEYFSML